MNGETGAQAQVTNVIYLTAVYDSQYILQDGGDVSVSGVLQA